MRSRSLFAFPILTLALGCASAQAQTTPNPIAPAETRIVDTNTADTKTAEYKLSPEELKKWVARLKLLCPPQGWTVIGQDNDVLLQRDQPVRFWTQSRHSWNPRGEKGIVEPATPSDATFRLRVHFSPLISQDKYEQLAIENEVTKQQTDALMKKYNFSRGKGWMDNGDPTTAAQRRSDYRREAANLKLHTLPDFYSTDYTVTLYHSWSNGQRPVADNETVNHDYNAVLESINRFFGTYSPRSAKNGTIYGLAEEQNNLPTTEFSPPDGAFE